MSQLCLIMSSPNRHSPVYNNVPLLKVFTRLNPLSSVVRWNRLFSPFSPFLTISLCVAGQYFSDPVFSILCDVFSQSVFLHVFLYLFFGRPLLLRPETSSRNDFAQMWSGSRPEQWPNHFSLLFSRNVSTGFMVQTVQVSQNNIQPWRAGGRQAERYREREI